MRPEPRRIVRTVAELRGETSREDDDEDEKRIKRRKEKKNVVDQVRNPASLVARRRWA